MFTGNQKTRESNISLKLESKEIWKCNCIINCSISQWKQLFLYFIHIDLNNHCQIGCLSSCVITLLPLVWFFFSANVSNEPLILFHEQRRRHKTLSYTSSELSQMIYHNHHQWWLFFTWQIPTIIITDKNPPWWSVMVGISWVTFFQVIIVQAIMF